MIIFINLNLGQSQHSKLIKLWEINIKVRIKVIKGNITGCLKQLV